MSLASFVGEPSTHPTDMRGTTMNQNCSQPTLGARLRRRLGDERGQTTAEYALVLLAAATIAMLVVAWATSTGKIGLLFDAVIDSITGLLG